MDSEPGEQSVPPSPSDERASRQPLPPSLIGSRVPQWEIYRFELVFFDPEFQRWQLFQENVGTGTAVGSGHRRPIQELLNSLRRAFGAVPRGTAFAVVPAHTSDEIEVTLNSAQWQTLEQSSKNEGVDLPSAWSSFVSALRENAKADGLLAFWQRHLLEMDEWPRKLQPTGAIASLKLHPAEARELISLLPISAHWDLYGAIREGWAPGETAHPESLWQDLGRLSEPFYCNHLIYLYDLSDDCTFWSKKILGYGAAVEAAFSDLSGRNLQPVSVSPSEYFDYAYRPSGVERVFYQLYALFMDRIQLEFSSPGDDNKNLYYLAYPIFSGLNRRHFLHVYVRPDRQDATILDLWSAWRQLHGHLNWGDLRHVLVDELEQVDLARFQNSLMRKLRSISSERHVPRDAQKQTYLYPIVANQIHLLFPIHCACQASTLGLYFDNVAGAPGGKAWNDLAPLSSSSGLGETLHCKGNLGAGKACRRTRRPDSVPPIVWNEDTVLKQTPVQREVADGRRQRLVHRQIEFAEIIWDSLEETRQKAQRDNEKDWREKEGTIVKNKLALLAALRNDAATCEGRFADPQVSALLKMPAPQFFKPFFYNQYIDVIGESAWRRAYIEVARASLHLLLSEYVETGVVRWLTHSAPSSGPAKLPAVYVKSEYDKAWQRVESVFKSLAGFEPLIGGVGEIHSHICKLLNGYSSGDIQSNCAGKALRDAREGLRTEIPENSLKQFLSLKEADTAFQNSKPTLNVQSQAFGIRIWDTAIQQFREAKGGAILPLTAGIVETGQCHELKSEFHPSVPARLTRSYVLIGNRTTSQYSEKVDIPKRFNGLIELMTVLGETLWAFGLCNGHNTARLLRLPECIDIHPADVPGFEDVEAFVRPKLPAGELYEFLIFALDRYKVVEAGIRTKA